MEYRPAYIISNEDQHWTTIVVPNAKRVLTVAGSGDQALFYKLAGAQYIDTFDINQNAVVIQDIKFAAIKHLNRDEYVALVREMCHGTAIMNIPQMSKLAPYMTRRAEQIIAQHGSPIPMSNMKDFYMSLGNIPTESEYEKLKNVLDKPFRFIASDIADIHTKIYGKYDLINISNIFDTIDDVTTQAKILIRLATRLKVGGYIVYPAQYQRIVYTTTPISATNGITIAYQETKKHQGNTAVIFQRTR